MSTEITGIRILSKERRTLRFTTFLLYQDEKKMPRTYGFGVQVLIDNQYDSNKCPLLKDIGEFDGNKTLEYGQKYISKLELSDFRNFPLTPEFLKGGNDLLHGSSTFSNEEWLPQATYEMEVTDEKWLEHIRVGDTWGSTACDFDSPYWYLTKIDAEAQYYKVYQDRKDRKWKIEYGVEGKKPRVLKKNGWNHYGFAMSAVRKKCSKSGGFKIAQRNFDTDYQIEGELSASYAGIANLATEDGRQYGLEQAIYNRNPKQLTEIIALGVDCNGRPGKKTPLEMLTRPLKSMKKTLACAKLLLDNGADVNKETPIVKLFISPKSLPLIQLLLDYKADLTLTNTYDQETALHKAIMISSEFTALALDNGADPSHKTTDGKTAKELLLFFNRPHTADTLKVFEERGY